MKKLILPFIFFYSFGLFSQSVEINLIQKEVDSLIILTKNLLQKRKIDQAMDLMKQAEQLCEGVIEKDNPVYALVLFNIGRIYRFKSKYGEAESYISKALDIQHETIGKENSDYAESLNNLAIVKMQTNQLAEAETMFLEVMEIRGKIFGKDHIEYAKILNNIGILYKGQWRNSEALSLLSQSKEILINALGAEHPYLATTSNNLAIIYKNMGDYQKAEPLYLEVKSKNHKVYGPKSAQYANSLNSLGLFYERVNNYQKGEQCFLEALEIRGNVLGKDHLHYAHTLNNLGLLYSEWKKYEKSEPYFLEALSVKEKVLGKEHPNYGSTLNNLANLYRKLNKYSEAESFIKEALTIWEKNNFEETAHYCNGLNVLGKIYYQTEQFDESEAIFLQSKDLRKRIEGAKSARYSGILLDLALLYERTGDLEKASAYFFETNTINRNYLQTAAQYLSENELSLLVSSYQSSIDKHYSFLHSTNENSSSAYDNALFYKGYLLNAIGKIRRLVYSETASANLFQELQELRRRLSNEYSKPLASRIDVSDIEEEANFKEKELIRTVVGYEENNRQVSWKDVQKQLKPGEAAIEFIRFKFYELDGKSRMMYSALVNQPGLTAPKLVPLFEEKELEALLEKGSKRKWVQMNKLYGYSKSESGKNLNDLIWKPLTPFLRDVETVYFSPTGLLHRLNLGAIVLNAKKVASETFALVQLNSSRQLVFDTEYNKSKRDAKLLGGIQYDLDTLGQSKHYADVTLVSRGEPIPFVADTTVRGGSWGYLEFTAEEVAKNAEILRSADFAVELVTGTKATEEVIQEIGDPGMAPRILHLATHGFFYPDSLSTSELSQKSSLEKESAFKVSNHPMIRSGLILAGGNHVWEGNPPIENRADGILTAYEISQLDLSNTELVVLSACETGLGDIEGNEGVFGLQRAFKIAGAKYLIMSLWQVPDLQTKELMTTFYSKWLLDKLPVREAFQNAQKVMKEKYQNPYFWAGFVLVE